MACRASNPTLLAIQSCLSAPPVMAEQASVHPGTRVSTSGGAAADLTVWWDQPEDRDPENPRNWSSLKKWANVVVISTISFLV